VLIEPFNQHEAPGLSKEFYEPGALLKVVLYVNPGKTIVLTSDLVTDFNSTQGAFQEGKNSGVIAFVFISQIVNVS